MRQQPEPITAEPPPLPGSALVRQEWRDVVFLHWPYRPAVIQGLLPRELSVDTFDGWGWIGLIPFRMHNLRPAGAPRRAGIGSFVEINVRTYVVDRLGRRAVWFFSLDVPRPDVVAITRLGVGVPYCLARVGYAADEGGARQRYALRRIWPGPRGAGAAIDVRVGAPIAPRAEDPLDAFLTARWAAATRRGRRLLRAPVAHERWPLHEAETLAVDAEVVAAAGLPDPSGAPRARYAPLVNAAFSAPTPIAPA